MGDGDGGIYTEMKMGDRDGGIHGEGGEEGEAK